VQDDWGWGVVVSVLKKPLRTNAAVNGGAAIANAAAAAATGDRDDIPVDLKAVAANAASCYIVDTLLPCKAGSVAAGVTRPDPIGIGQVSGSAAAGDGKVNADAGAGDAAAGSNAELTVVPVLLPLVTSLSSLRVTLPEDIRPLDVRQNLLLVLQVGHMLNCVGPLLKHAKQGGGVPCVGCVSVLRTESWWDAGRARSHSFDDVALHTPL
jgi:ATP-dependent RNA helicase DOB1